MNYKKSFLVLLSVFIVSMFTVSAVPYFKGTDIDMFFDKFYMKTPDASMKFYAKEHDLFGNENGESIELRQYNTSYPEAKPYIGWYTYDPASDSVRGTGWIGCHQLSMTDVSNPNHNHCSWETLDNNSGTPVINTKFEIKYGSNLTKADSDLYAKFSGLYSVNFGQDVRLIMQGGSIQNNGTMDIYPDKNSYGTHAIQVGISSGEPVIRALGGSIIQIDDDLKLIGSSSDIMSTDTVDLFPNNQGTIALSVSSVGSEGQISVFGSSVLRVNDDVKILTLTGTGNAYACLDANGQLYRSNVTCI